MNEKKVDSAIRTGVLKPETHIEISDGDTMFLSLGICPLQTPNHPQLQRKNVPCCIIGDMKCDHFWKFIHSTQGTTIQCDQLSTTEIPEYTKVNL